MSIRLMADVWELQIPQTDKLVLLALADNANDSGVCWPGTGTVERKTCLSERTVQSCFQRLSEAGHISIEYRPGRSSVFSVHPRSSCTPQEMHPRNSRTDPRISCGTTPAAPAPTPAAPAPITIKESSSESSREPGRVHEIPFSDHALPPDWDSQLREVYPKRSGASGFGGVKLMLKIRTALAKTSWSEILAGVKRYAEYVEKSGEAGSRFVKGPANFFEEGCYLETFEYKAPEDPKVIEARNKEADRWRRAREAAGELDPALTPYPLESIAAFETRIALARTRGPAAGRGRDEVGARIANLANRMRIAQ